MSKIAKVGIIGCGRISGHHCKSIIETDGVELIGVCDIEVAKAHAYRDAYGTKAYTNYREMIEQNPEINTVAIITPSGMHHEHSLEILKKYKKNIIVEKPTFMKPSQLIEAYKVANELGLQVFPVFQNRHNLAIQRVKKGIITGELGKVRTISVRVRWCRPQRYYNLAAWRGTFAMDGGCLTNQGVHHVDLLRYFAGNPTMVSAIMKTLGANIEVEDTMVGTVMFENNIIGNLEVTTAARPNDYEASISLVCENGLAQIGGIAVNELQVYTPDPSSCKLNSEDFSGNVYGNGHVKLYQEISAFFNKSVPFSVSYLDALDTIKLLNAFYVSDERKSYVTVNDAGDSIRLGRNCDELANLYRTK
jgi:UDP-N-acetyl-2-amino-2-deoxyglucuronate dehydrogenase